MINHSIILGTEGGLFALLNTLSSKDYYENVIIK